MIFISYAKLIHCTGLLSYFKVKSLERPSHSCNANILSHADINLSKISDF